MNIFIDESGRFRSKITDTADKFQCIVAVIMNDEALAEFEQLYGTEEKKFLRENWKDILTLLDKHECKAFAVIVDSNLCLPSIIKKQRDDYIRSIHEATEKDPFWLLKTVRNHAGILTNLKKYPSYIKALLSIKLRENILRGVLGNSAHFLKNDDLENIKIIYDTEEEDIIPTIKYFSLLTIYCNSVKKPICVDNKNNVSHFCHFNGKCFNATAFFENTTFASSKSSIGVRIVDVIANQVFRNLNNKVVPSELDKWQKLFSMTHSFDCISFGQDEAFVDTPISENGRIFAEACSSSFKED